MEWQHQQKKKEEKKEKIKKKSFVYYIIFLSIFLAFSSHIFIYFLFLIFFCLKVSIFSPNWLLFDLNLVIKLYSSFYRPIFVLPNIYNLHEHDNERKADGNFFRAVSMGIKMSTDYIYKLSIHWSFSDL